MAREAILAREPLDRELRMRRQIVHGGIVGAEAFQRKLNKIIDPTSWPLPFLVPLRKIIRSQSKDGVEGDGTGVLLLDGIASPIPKAILTGKDNKSEQIRLLDGLPVLREAQSGILQELVLGQNEVIHAGLRETNISDPRTSKPPDQTITLVIYSGDYSTRVSIDCERTARRIRVPRFEVSVTLFGEGQDKDDHTVKMCEILRLGAYQDEIVFPGSIMSFSIWLNGETRRLEGSEPVVSTIQLFTKYGVVPFVMTTDAYETKTGGINEIDLRVNLQYSPVATTIALHMLNESRQLLSDVRSWLTT